jgi:DNA-binding MarR family transcriptional regulator
MSISKSEREWRRRQTEAMVVLGRLHRVIERRAGALLADQGLHGITPAQANVMMILFQAGAPMRARTVARTMGVSEVTVGRFVQALVRESWLERREDPSDGRAKLLEPTSKAYSALPRFIAVSNTVLDAAFEGIDPATGSVLAEAVARISSNLEGETD